MRQGSSHGFDTEALRQRDVGIVSELWQMMCDSKKWWMLPLLAALLLVGALMLLSLTPAAPFIYTLF